MAPTLQGLPIEIIDNILDILKADYHLWSDTRYTLLCLRLTCRELHTKTLAHFAREYFTRVSINTTTGNIHLLDQYTESEGLEKARRIALHDLFRNSVKELQIMDGRPTRQRYLPSHTFANGIDSFVSQAKCLSRLEFRTKLSKRIPSDAAYRANGRYQPVGDNAQEALFTALHAIRKHEVHLRTLKCVNRSNEASPQVVSLLDACNAVEGICGLFDQLDTLTIGGMVSSHQGPQPVTLNNVLLSAPRLTALHLGGHCKTQTEVGNFVANASACVASLRFLKTFTLDMMRFEGDALSQLLHSCSRTLQQLKISSISLERKTWNTVLATIAGHLDLSRLKLDNIREGLHGEHVIFERIHRARFACFPEDDFEEIDSPVEPHAQVDPESEYPPVCSLAALFHNPPEPSDSLSEPFMIVAPGYRDWEQRRLIQLDRNEGDDMREWLSFISENYELSDYPYDW